MTRNGFQDIISPATGGSGHGSFGSSSPNLKDLADCSDLATATDGQVPVWNDATLTWEPKTLTSPIIYLGNGAWDATKVLSKADNYGMPAHTVPDPQAWSPQGGDQYIDLATGNITIFTGAGTVVPTHYRLAMPSALADGTALSITITPQGGTPIAVAYRSNAADTSAVVLAADVLAALQAEASLTPDFQFSLDTTTVAADSVDVLGLTAKAGAFTIAVTGGITSTLIAGGPTTPASPAPRSDPSGITAGVSSLDLAPNDLDSLADVSITNPLDGQVLAFDQVAQAWVNQVVIRDVYTKAEVDAKIDSLITSIEQVQLLLKGQH